MKNNRLELVDYLKGISIAGIVVYHLLTVFWGITGPIALAASFAGAGIHLFNVCSGFGLALSQSRTPLTAGAFFRKRFFKVYLPYFLVITLHLATSGFIFQSVQPLRDYLSHVFLYKMFIEFRINTYGGHFWYISTIFQFYLLFPLLYRGRKRLGSRSFFLLCLAVSLLWMACGQWLDLAGLRTYSNCALQYLWEFALGICLAERYHSRGSVTEKPLPLLPVTLISLVCLILYGLTSLKGGVFQSFSDFFAAPAIFGIYYLLYRLLPLGRPFLWVSKFSFSWYLTHYLVFHAVFQLLPLGNLLRAVISLPASLLFAWSFQKMIDKIRK